jgi:Uma2 family endonuclease
VSTLPQLDEQLDYQDSDGKPMGETPIHGDNLAYLVDMLRAWYRPDPMVYVAGNMFLYYEEGNHGRSVIPDVFVVKGVPRDTKPRRRVFLTWREGKVPNVIIELTSKSSQDEDLEDKFRVYRDKIKVQEYIVFDPLDEYLEPRLKGWKLKNGKYVPLAWKDNRLVSEVLGLHLEADGEFLRLWDPVSGQYIPSPPEVREILRQMEEEKREAGQALKKEKREREKEKKAREQEQQLREKEQQARLKAEDEVRQLKERLRKRGRNGEEKK